MANKFTNPQYYTDIANAIRTINGLSRTYTPPQMAQAILDLNIATGEAPELIGLEIVSPPNRTSFVVGDTFDSTGIIVKALYAGGYYRWVSDDVTFSIAEGYIFTRSDSGSMVITVTYVDEWDGIATANFELTVNETVSFEVRGYFSKDTSTSSSRIIDFKIYTEYLSSIKIILDSSFETDYGYTKSLTWNIYGGNNSITSTASGDILESCTCSATNVTSPANETIIYENYDLENSDYDWIGLYQAFNQQSSGADTKAKIICSLRDNKTMKFNFKSYNGSQYLTNIYIKPLVIYTIDNIVLTNGIGTYQSTATPPWYYIQTSSTENTIDFDNNIDWNEWDKNSGIELKHDKRNSNYNVDYLFTYKTLSNISLSSISIESLPKKLNYYTGDQLDLTGLVVKALYSDGIVQEIGGYITSIANHSTLDSSGVKTITISHTEKGITKTASFTINITQSQFVNGVQIVSWADGTDAQVSAMVTAADQGKINLTNYWHVGDERVISLNSIATTDGIESHAAQDIIMVLVDNNNQNYTYVTTPSSGRTYPFFIVQQKNGLNETGKMNNTSYNTGSWEACKRRVWCNDVYKAAYPSTIQNIFHQVKVKTVGEYNATTIQETNDYFFLPTTAEVFKGDSTYGTGGTAGQNTALSNLTEFNALSRWEYYSTTEKRIKTQGNSGETSQWYSRSPYYSSNRYYAGIDRTGIPTAIGPAGDSLIAPAGCI